MGHIRLGSIPKTNAWDTVVAAVLSAPSDKAIGSTTPAREGIDNDIAKIAAATLNASSTALTQALEDEGLCHTFYLLTQLAKASRNEDWYDPLLSVGIDIARSDSILGLAAAFQSAVDEHLLYDGNTSDVGEIAQKAAGEAICDLAADRSRTLFGDSDQELRLAVRSLSTKAGFGRLSRQFFGRFLTRFLNFYISRIAATHIGEGPFRSLAAISSVDEKLAYHCIQSAAIVQDFSAEWYSKTEYEGGINPDKARGFVAVALRKLADELQAQQRTSR